jgi:hypothetical protein
MKTLLPAALALAALVLGPGCDTGFDPQYLVKDLRILAVRAQVEGTPGAGTADAHPGDTLRLEALVVNPRARPGLVVTWYGCLPVASERLLPCVDPEYVRDLDRLVAAADAPEETGVLRLGTCTPAPGDDRCGIPLTVPDAPEVQAALRFLEDEALANRALECRLYAELPVLAVAEAGGARQLALKRVRVAQRPEALPESLREIYTVNLNPAVEDVRRAAGGSEGCAGAGSLDPDALPAGESVLCGLRAGTTQAFYVCGGGGREEPPAVEEASWQWYATGGEFPEFDGVGNATGADVDFVRPAGAFTLWTILRDGRGGESWLRRDVAALP